MGREFVLEPDGQVTSTQYRSVYRSELEEHELVEETQQEFRLAQRLATKIRYRLAVFRPPALSSDTPFVLPKGCGFAFHIPSIAVVEFRDGEDGALFIRQSTCENRAAKTLNEELQQISMLFDEDKPR